MTLGGDFPVFRAQGNSGRSDDFMSFHPVPPPPAPETPPDFVGDEFTEAQKYAEATPIRGWGRSMNLVDRLVCKYPCPLHDHGTGPVFRPDPELDEVGIGWTVQHVPTDLSGYIVPKHCIMCWEDLTEHDCRVLAVVNG